MDKKEAIVKAKKFLGEIKSIIKIDKAYLFGSHASNTGWIDSDIDIGIFTTMINDDYFTALKKLYRVRRNNDPRIEPHLFIEGKDISGFAEEVERTGERIE